MVLPWAELTISPEPSGVQANPAQQIGWIDHLLRHPAGGIHNQQAHRKESAPGFPQKCDPAVIRRPAWIGVYRTGQSRHRAGPRTRHERRRQVRMTLPETEERQLPAVMAEVARPRQH